MGILEKILTAVLFLVFLFTTPAHSSPFQFNNSLSPSPETPELIPSHTVHVATKHNLPALPPQLPIVYLVFSLVYLCFLGFWISVCSKNRRCFHRMHLLMGGLLLTTLFHLIMCGLANQHYLEVTCTPHGWNVLLYIFQFIRIVLFFVVIMLLGTGWCFWKPCLDGREKLVLMIVILIQVTLNLVSILIGETDTYADEDRIHWYLNISFIDLCSFLAVLAPLWWSLETCGRDARFAKLEWNFRVSLAYFLISRLIIKGQPNYVVYQCPWLVNSSALDETGMLVVCMVLFYVFRPSEKSTECIGAEKAAEMGMEDEDETSIIC